MRLSAWRAVAPNRDALGPKVTAVLEPVLATLGSETDPDSWVIWGDDPATKYTILVPTAASLAVCAVRINVPQEGPRVGGKLVRWGKVQLSELSIESQAGHRLLTFQIEQHVMRGVDDEADRMAAFVGLVFAAVDGRPLPKLNGRAVKRPRAKPKGASRPGGTARRSLGSPARVRAGGDRRQGDRRERGSSPAGSSG